MSDDLLKLAERPFGVSWIENRPETAIGWRWYWLRYVAEFVLGIRAFRVNPTKLKRIQSAWWWEPKLDGSPIEVAQWIEEVRPLRARSAA